MDKISSNLLYYRGRVGLREILIGLELQPGDIVATQAFTCSAVPEAILAAECRPLYIDLEDGGVNLCPDNLEARLSSDVKCIVVQHTFGIPAQIDRIVSIAAHRDIPIVEDCCHTLDSKLNSQVVGSFGKAAFYSHEWGKPIVCGVGGSLRINDENLKVKLLSRYQKFNEPGMKRSIRLRAQFAAFSLLYRPEFYWPIKRAFHALSRKGVAEGNYNDLGSEPSPEFGLRMPKTCRARLKSKLKNLVNTTQHSRQIAEIYAESLNSHSMHSVIQPQGAETTFSRFPLWTNDKQGIIGKAQRENIEVADWYATPIHPFTGNDLASIGYTFGSCPNAEAACERIVSLPVHAKTSIKQAKKIASLLH
ncbi:DegT/DnrJ/EryC1/StrS family aminotransferase [Pelagicoccus enzymogenes]|uniref:DegT/DnrJ/EryC1/StrS family aminotransferase n=1 Tax=Pelagicoccus enzymogenes TaxID=2773457 RepID=UPI00280F4F21|nr:DegT/DnrJ/EryC1/StrS family aminotransferase [Pelagicoccus enzymogenes]